MKKWRKQNWEDIGTFHMDMDVPHLHMWACDVSGCNSSDLL